MSQTNQWGYKVTLPSIEGIRGSDSTTKTIGKNYITKSFQTLVTISDKGELKISNDDYVFDKLKDHHSKEGIIVSFIGKSKTFKSTLANDLFNTRFKTGTNNFETTTSSIDAHSSFIEKLGGGKVVTCLDFLGFPGFQHTRDISSEKEMDSIDKKIILLSLSVSSIVFFTMHDSDYSPVREFAAKLERCKEFLKDSYAKPHLVFLVVVSACTEKNYASQDPSLSREEIRRKISNNLANISTLDMRIHQFFAGVSVECVFKTDNNKEIDFTQLGHVQNSVLELCFYRNSINIDQALNNTIWKDILESINNQKTLKRLAECLSNNISPSNSSKSHGISGTIGSSFGTSFGTSISYGVNQSHVMTERSYGVTKGTSYGTSYGVGSSECSINKGKTSGAISELEKIGALLEKSLIDIDEYRLLKKKIIEEMN